MRVVFDCVMLSLFFHPDARPPKPVERPKDRVNLLVETLSSENAKILIPAPVLGEFLAMPGAHAYLAEIENSDVFDVVPFDKLAAIDAAAQHLEATAGGDKRGGAQGPWQKIKVDRQVVAIARVARASRIHSDDGDVATLGRAVKMPVVGIGELPLPPVTMKTIPLPLGEETATGATSPAANVTARPSEQSPAAVTQTTVRPEQVPPSIRPGGPTQPPQGSSRPAARRPRSKR